MATVSPYTLLVSDFGRFCSTLAGVLGADASAVVDGAVGVDCKLALIGGTSSCHMAVSR